MHADTLRAVAATLAKDPDVRAIIEDLVRLAAKEVAAQAAANPTPAVIKMAMSEAEVAEAVGVSANTVRAWRQTHGLCYVKLDGRVLIRREALEKFLVEHERKTAEGAA